MPKVTYILPDGTENQVELDCEQTIMEGAVNNNLPGIVAECGGSCACATCHVYVDEESSADFAAANDDERDLLQYLDGVQSNSRLSCQLVVHDGSDGARVTVPDNEY